MEKLVLVFLGGGAGAVARHLAGLQALRAFGTALALRHLHRQRRRAAC